MVLKNMYSPLPDLLRHKTKLGFGYDTKKHVRSLKERKVYGLCLLDIWNYGRDCGPSVLYQAFQRMNSDLSIAACLQLALIDNLEEGDWLDILSFKQQAAMYKEAENALGVIFEAMVPEIFFADIPEHVFQHDYAALESFSPMDDVKWKEWKGIFEDPTKDYISKLIAGKTKNERKNILKKHHSGRITYGMSVYDLEYSPLSYFAWQFVNVSVFCLSNESHLVRPYAQDLLKCAKGMYVLGFGKNATLTDEQKEFSAYAARHFPELVGNLWD